MGFREHILDLKAGVDIPLRHIVFLHCIDMFLGQLLVSLTPVSYTHLKSPAPGASGYDGLAGSRGADGTLGPDTEGCGSIWIMGSVKVTATAGNVQSSIPQQWQASGGRYAYGGYSSYSINCRGGGDSIPGPFVADGGAGGAGGGSGFASAGVGSLSLIHICGKVKKPTFR